MVETNKIEKRKMKQKKEKKRGPLTILKFLKNMMKVGV